MSRVTGHASHFTYPVSHVILCIDILVELDRGGSVINGAYPSSFWTSQNYRRSVCLIGSGEDKFTPRITKDLK